MNNARKGKLLGHIFSFSMSMNVSFVVSICGFYFDILDYNALSG